MFANRRDEILSKVSTISSLPPTAAEAARLLQDPESSIRDLVRAIELDPGLTSNVLRLANSAYYGCPESIGSIKDAVVRLGTKCIFQMVMSWGFAALAQKHVAGYRLPVGGLWEHSIAVAVGAEQLPADLHRKSPDYAFTAGLLHDIGKSVLGNFVAVDFEPIMEMVKNEKVTFEVAEHRVLGIDHAEVGAVLLESWNLPACVVEVCRWHHEPGWFSGESLALDIVHVVDAMCLMGGIGAGIDSIYYQTSPEVISRLNLSAFATDRIISRILGKIDEARGLFSPQHSTTVSSPGPAPYRGYA